MYHDFLSMEYLFVMQLRQRTSNSAQLRKRAITKSMERYAGLGLLCYSINLAYSALCLILLPSIHICVTSFVFTIISSSFSLLHVSHILLPSDIVFATFMTSGVFLYLCTMIGTSFMAANLYLGPVPYTNSSIPYRAINKLLPFLLSWYILRNCKYSSCHHV